MHVNIQATYIKYKRFRGKASVYSRTSIPHDILFHALLQTWVFTSYSVRKQDKDTLRLEVYRLSVRASIKPLEAPDQSFRN
jgi:hypothetical protein